MGEECLPNHYMSATTDAQGRQPCVPCNCNENGSENLQCSIDGKCACKAGMFGDKCEVSTVSHNYNRHIVVPRAYILGADEYYAQAGGDISLVCIIEDNLGPPENMYWYHNNKILNYNISRIRASFGQGQGA